MAYTAINKPTDHFETKLHNGTGSSKTLAYDFEVDFFWTKKRNDGYGAYIYDSVRGNNKRLQVSQTNAEGTTGNTISFGNSSGVTIGSDSGNYGVNQTQTDGGSAATYVGWGWLAGGSASSNSDGSITSSVSANTTAGFSIVSYTGTGSNATVGHGLGAVPKMIFFKDRETSVDWGVYAEPIGNTKEMYLSTNDAAGTNSGAFNNTTPTSSVFTIGTSSRYNPSSKGVIAYCFAEVKGYSKIGLYTGTGSVRTYIHTGFKPAWVIRKRTDSANNWGMNDNKRNPFNIAEELLTADTTNAASDGTGIDMLSNGFRVMTNSSLHNTSGGTYLYMAFAESPFVTSKGIPTTAR